MSFSASFSQIIFAEIDGLAETGLATWTVVPGPPAPADVLESDGTVVFVVLDEVFELPPQAVASRRIERATGAIRRVRTERAYRLIRFDWSRDRKRPGSGGS